MDNLIKPLLENYSKHYIEKQKSPTYIEMYTKSNRDVVLVCNKVNI